MRLQRLLLAGVLLVYTALALWYTAMAPLGEGVDEVAHFDYVLFVKDTHRLPAQRPAEGRIDTPMGHHPPLYYALGALLISPIDTADRAQVLHNNPHFVWDTEGRSGWNAMLPGESGRFPWSGTLLAFRLLRLFDVALGGVAIACTYLAARRLMPAQPWAALGAAAVIGLNPSFIYMASTVHHDVLQAALYSAGLLWCVIYAGRRVTLGALVGAGVIVACAILTKLSGASLAPAVSILILLRARHAGDWGSRLQQVLVVALTAALLAGWWFMRNLVLYGDPFGWQMWLTVFAHTARHGPFNLWLFEHDFLAGFARTFWGAFGFMHILLPAQVWWIAWGVSGVALLGWVFVIGRQLRRRTVERDRLVAWAAVVAGLALLFLSFVRMAFSVVGAGHGRYLFPGAVAIGALLIAGANGYARWRWQRAITLLVCAGMATYAVWAPATYAWPKYRTPSDAASEARALGGETKLAFAKGLRLVEVKVSSAVVIPGQGLDVTTYWAAGPGVDPNLDPYVTLLLEGEDGQPLEAPLRFWPEISTAPRAWGARVIKNVQAFYIPPDIAAGKLRVRLSVVDHTGGEQIDLKDAPGRNGAVVAELMALGQVERIAPPAVPRHDLRAVFAGVVQLETAVVPATVPAGGVLPVELYWQVLAPVAGDYTVFVHVLDGQGKLVAQLDRPPGGGTSPTSSWQPGTYLHDTYPVPLPADLPPGPYRVRMGLYVWPELARQPVAFDGETADDAILIGSVTVRY